MSKGLDNLNDFLVEATNGTSGSNVQALSAVSNESVIIDSKSKEYLTEVHFLNPLNTYEGDFLHVNGDGTRNSIYDMVVSAMDLSSSISETNQLLDTSIKNLSATFDWKLANTSTSVSRKVLENSMEYTDRRISETLATYGNQIDDLSSNVVIPHIRDEEIHVRKNGALQVGLNVELFNGYDFSNLMNYSATHTIQRISALDCGTI